MKLVEALQVVNAARRRDLPPSAVLLACGFTPLHLATFLAAHLQTRDDARRVAVEVGLYGDLFGTLARAAAQPSDGVAVVVEWADLDPRLGLRGAGGWMPAAEVDVVASAAAALRRLVAAVGDVSAATPTVVSLPTLPLPPLWHTAGWQAGEAELRLRAAVATAAADLAAQPRTRVIAAARLDARFALDARGDARAELSNGFPYRQEFADALASQLADGLRPPAPKKGIVTDLDDTLWRGILGEVGVDGVACTLDAGAQVHALYQQLLASLAGAGVLVAIASKNDAALVARALERDDHLLRPHQIYPVVANWGAKSESIRAILEAWNVGADSIVFVDDSPMELAEVQDRHPDVTCLRFPGADDPAGVVALLARLRDLCGKPALTGEDAVRLESLRAGAAMREGTASGAAAAEEFLAGADAEIVLDFAKDRDDARALELVNKTNQFNLNGRRIAESEWLRRLDDPAAFVLTVSYRDRFGALGKIAVLSGAVADAVVHVDTWVLSCRAFARRVEHASLRALFDRFDAREVVLDFAPTERNGPTREFLAELLGDAPWPDAPRLSRGDFDARCRPTYHAIRHADATRVDQEPSVHG